ncbi:hypothetical protein M758_UG084300, partial [Ceratodon purpureus]
RRRICRPRSARCASGKVWERSCWDDVKMCTDRCKAERKKESKPKQEESSSSAIAMETSSAGNVSQMGNGIGQEKCLSVAGMLDLHHFLMFSLCPHRFMASHNMR